MIEQAGWVYLECPWCDRKMEVVTHEAPHARYACVKCQAILSPIAFRPDASIPTDNTGRIQWDRVDEKCRPVVRRPDPPVEQQPLMYSSRARLADDVALWLQQNNAPPKIVNIITALNAMKMLRSEKVGGCDL